MKTFLILVILAAPCFTQTRDTVAHLGAIVAKAVSGVPYKAEYPPEIVVVVSGGIGAEVRVSLSLGAGTTPAAGQKLTDATLMAIMDGIDAGGYEERAPSRILVSAYRDLKYSAPSRDAPPSGSPPGVTAAKIGEALVTTVRSGGVEKIPGYTERMKHRKLVAATDYDNAPRGTSAPARRRKTERR